MPSRRCRHPASRRHGTRLSGFSLIEVMVAMAIGMAAVIIMMQMLMNSDSAKRITVGGNDAQINGTIALFNLERELRSAGFGLNSAKLLGCGVTLTRQGGAQVTVPLAPVTIYRGDNSEGLVPKGDEHSDRLLVVYAEMGESADGDPLTAVSSEASYPITTPRAFRDGDLVVLQGETRANPCTLTAATVRGINGKELTVENGTALMPSGSIAFNLGRLAVHAYAVRGGNLTMCDYVENDCGNAANVDNEDIWVPVASNIVALRAQYAKDLADTSKPMTGTITEFNQDVPRLGSGLAIQCAWARTVAVRVALVARDTAYDKSRYDKDKDGNYPDEDELPPPPTWSGAVKTEDNASGPKNPTPVAFDLSKSIEDPAFGAEWRRYRYKAFETSIPLRNTIWQGDVDC